jgi:hypothetical protein
LGYLVAIGMYFVPTEWAPPPIIAFVLCPAALASLTVAPSFGTVAFILAPLNALIYCGVGAVIGLFTVARRSE